MVRANAEALGANALLCYRATPEESTSGRNQVYHMMSVTGQVSRILAHARVLMSL